MTTDDEIGFLRRWREIAHGHHDLAFGGAEPTEARPDEHAALTVLEQDVNMLLGLPLAGIAAWDHLASVRCSARGGHRGYARCWRHRDEPHDVHDFGYEQ